MADVVRAKTAASRGETSYIRREVLTVPNLFTLSRFCCGILIFFLTRNPQTVFYLAFWGAVSDFFDGYLAKKLGQATEFGKRFDQVTDFVFGFSLIYIIWRWEGTTLYNIPIAVGLVAFAYGVWKLRKRGLAINSSKTSKRRIFFQFAAAVVIIGTHAALPIPHLGMLMLRTIAYVVLWFSLYLTWRTYVGYLNNSDE
ncbi:CDP-alcohol phosphatidyltransferase family protein [Candidatus Kaiserbacteria bacterium]|nr:CDP-alcohol phosphatidyltransferase family protein [Candidatus Kaiserbacteria bacterium]